MKIEIVSTVKIKIVQQDVEQMILDKIAQENPDVSVESIEFVQRRDPSRMEVNVKAVLGELPKAEPEEVEFPESTEAEEASTVGDIFGGE